jgi:aldose 1-epimerase
MRVGGMFGVGVLGAIGIALAASATQPASKARFQARPFGKTQAGEPVELYTLTNSKGMEVAITNYGGIVVSIKVPDRTGKLADVVLGFDNLEGYLLPPPYFGAVIGRYGNRIAHGKFTLDGVEYTLPRNDGGNTLHGGPKGFDKVLWKAREVEKGRGLELTYLSPDGEAGFPGNLSVTVTYTLTDANELKIDYRATTDKDTVVNLTNHSYFNLAGQGNGDILGHLMMINADGYTPVGRGLIPTGKIEPVEGTPFDFRKPEPIGARIGAKDPQLQMARGYDHNFVLNRKGDGLELAARVVEPTTGRVLEVLTTEPGVQFYSGNFLDGSIHGKGGKVYGFRSGFCLETQHFPDSPNKPEFPSTELKPGQVYHTTTVYRFSTEPAH